MADDSSDLLASRAQSKKRRIPGACDICKRKKIRCDSGEMPDNRCSNCVQFGYECTHKEVTKTLGSAKGYVESLESRLEKMDRLVSRLLPGIDINQEVDRMIDPVVDSPDPDPLSRTINANSTASMITTHLSKLNINPPQNRFFGKSSGFQLIATALDLKQEYTGDPAPKDGLRSFIPLKRHEFWDVPTWVTSNPKEQEERMEYVYPDEDLMPSLIEGYFAHLNDFLPLLHRPTFEKSVAEGLHLTDSMFGATLLLVCAHGARYSDDPRVLAEGTQASRSAGWKWFEQVNVLPKTLYNRTTLYELQMHALYVLFGQSSEVPQGIWAQIGLAVRLAQEVGAHRKRKTPEGLPTAEDELWKRAFWVILSLDRLMSSHSGRPCGLQDEDLDLDFPLECDDEYWDYKFQQPPGKASSIAYFNCFLRLMDILAYAMRLIYSIKRPTSFFGKTAPRSEQQVIAELDSAMNNWMDSVPSHLRWNPNYDNPLFLKQSAALHATYYHIQIFIHRPFIPSPRNPTPLGFPSLAICTNAARSCCHVLESFSRLDALPFTHLQNTAFQSAVILLLNIWSGRRSGIAPMPRREMEDVQRCMQVLKACEKRWAVAGRYWDILSELAFAGDVSIFNSPSPTVPRKKRLRESDEESPSITPPITPVDPHRSLAGTRRVSIKQSPQPPHHTPQLQPALFSLPMYGNELGRLPVYGQFNFCDSIGPRMHMPATNHDNYTSIVSASMGVPSHPDAFAMDSPFSSLSIESLASYNYNQPLATSIDFASLFACNSDSEGISQFGTMPAMDNDTMTMWSTAPTGLELDDWSNYISSVEQITQSQGHGNATSSLG